MQLSVEELSEKLKPYNYKLVRDSEVPIYTEKGWSAACYFGRVGDGVYILMHNEAA